MLVLFCVKAIAYIVPLTTVLKTARNKGDDYLPSCFCLVRGM